MCIIIKAKKEVNKDGEKVYRVLKVKALGKERLPKKYLEADPAIYYYERKLIKDEGCALCFFLCEGCEYTQQQWNEKIAYIKEAGDRLKQINDEIRRARQEWQGEVEVRI